MHILPINNTQYKQPCSFKAKFPRQDIKEFLRETTDGDVDIIPRLYTMLDIVKNYPGEKATIEHIGLWHKILIDGKSVSGDKKYFSAYHALLDATIQTPSTRIKNPIIKRLSEDEFENTYYKNSKKTAQDIEDSFIRE